MNSQIQRTTISAESGMTTGPPYDDLLLETSDNAQTSKSDNNRPGIELPPISPMKPYGRKLKGHNQRRTYGNQDKFRLDYDFKHKLRQLPEPWKGSPPTADCPDGKPDDVVAQIVFERTYQRDSESWAGVIIRVVEGAYNIQLRHFRQLGLPWNFKRAQKSAQEMATRMHVMKFLPPGRGLWAMGSPIIEQRRMYAALQNCAFISTEHLDRNPTEPFTFLMDASMLGVGVGWDTKGSGKVRVYEPLGTPDQPGKFDIYVVEDSRNGWVESVRLLLESYLRPKKNVIQFDYSEIRPKGAILKGFGGVSSGNEPLMVLHERLRKLLQSYIGKPVDTRFIADVMNMIGACVVSGNIRRTAEIGFGDPTDIAFMDLKDYEKNPEREAYGWTSNNSILATVGSDYNEIAKRMIKNGEPGLGWIDNMRSFGRMCDPPTDKDSRIAGANPCMEMGLEPHELCNLVETFPFKHENLADYLRTLEFAFLYAKTVTLECTHMPKTNEVMMRNRRIGTSVTGVTQFIAKHGLDTLRKWLDSGYNHIQQYDKKLSEIFCVPKSVKTTTVKPSGTVSLLAGATAGMHFPIMQCYIRRITISNDSHLYEKLKNAGYDLEPRYIWTDPETKEEIFDKNSSIVSCPVYLGDKCIKTESTVTMWEQLSLAAFLQRYWADNQVSCTVKFDPETESPHLVAALEHYQYHLKGISFLPKKCEQYRQAPYEAISHEKYLEMTAKLTPLDFRQNRSAFPSRAKREECDTSDEEDDDEDNDQSVQSLIDVLPDSLNFCDGDHCVSKC